MLNSYYKSEPDKMWDQLRENKKTSAFFDDAREYLLEEYSCNLTQFIELCISPVDTVEFWQELAESAISPKDAIDNLAQDLQGEKQQHYITDVVISSGNIHRRSS